MSVERIVETDEQHKKRMASLLNREYGKDPLAVGLKKAQGDFQEIHYPQPTVEDELRQKWFDSHSAGFLQVGTGAHLPFDAQERKQIPLYSGLVKYFPDALVEVAKLSKKANEQHNPGQPLHWAREKSTDQEDTLLRHLFEAGTIDTDGCRHSAKVAWRALAILQLEIERARNTIPANVQYNAGLFDAQMNEGPYEGFVRKDSK